MPKPDRLIGFSSGFELEFVEREATPEPAMKLGIQVHAAGLSLSDTVSVLAGLGVERCRSTVHNWVQKAGLQPSNGKNPNRVAVDETVIQLNDQRFWLYAAVDPDSNEFLHVRLFPTRTIILTKQFLQELAEKHDVANSLFLVDGAPWLQGRCLSFHSDFSMLPMEIGMLSNGCSKNSNAELSSSQRISATQLLTPQKHGSKPSPSSGIS